jgi:hypothetical protein
LSSRRPSRARADDGDLRALTAARSEARRRAVGDGANDQRKVAFREQKRTMFAPLWRQDARAITLSRAGMIFSNLEGSLK